MCDVQVQARLAHRAEPAHLDCGDTAVQAVQEVQYAIASPSPVKAEGKGISAARCRYSSEGRLPVPLTHQREFIINTFDRRVFLLHTGLGGITSMLWCGNASAARAKDAKLTKAAVQYTDEIGRAHV